MDISDFLGRDAFGDELVADVVIDVELVGIRSGEVAKDELCRAPVPPFFPTAVNILDRTAYLGVAMNLGKRVNEAHIERRLPAVAGDLQHVVHLGINPAVLEFLRTLD